MVLRSSSLSWRDPEECRVPGWGMWKVSQFGSRGRQEKPQQPSHSLSPWCCGLQRPSNRFTEIWVVLSFQKHCQFISCFHLTLGFKKRQRHILWLNMLTLKQDCPQLLPTSFIKTIPTMNPSSNPLLILWGSRLRKSCFQQPFDLDQLKFQKFQQNQGYQIFLETYLELSLFLLF